MTLQTCSVLSRDLRGRICLVTGANKGLGLEIAKGLARRGCTLYLACRSEERGKEAVEAVRHEADNRDVHLKVCDLASSAAIAALAAELDAKHTRLYLLVNNAGVMVSAHIAAHATCHACPRQHPVQHPVF
jgi:NAD(P)-dependent dehydrogenase (short-subunit alcohol dehydrogenase family)